MAYLVEVSGGKGWPWLRSGSFATLEQAQSYSAGLLRPGGPYSEIKAARIVREADNQVIEDSSPEREDASG
jgi:hypothetical protein